MTVFYSSGDSLCLNVVIYLIINLIKFHTSHTSIWWCNGALQNQSSVRVHHEKSRSPFASMPNAVSFSDTVGGEQVGGGTQPESQWMASNLGSESLRQSQTAIGMTPRPLSGVFIGSWCSAAAQAVNEEVQFRRCCSGQNSDTKCHFKTEPTFNHGSVSIQVAFKMLCNMKLNLTERIWLCILSLNVI